MELLTENKFLRSEILQWMMFDITGVDAQVGDIITLIDDKNTVDNWAEILGTINYELTCRLKVRLPRVYTR